MKTLAELKTDIKRRLRQISATTAPGIESERGNLYSDAAIKDAINAGRQAIVSFVERASVWSNQVGVFATVEDVQDYSLDTAVRDIISVLFNSTADGDRDATSVLALRLRDQAEEEMVVTDGMYTPSTSEPYYRLTNSGIRLVTSTDGSVVAGDYMRIEFDGDLDDLESDSSSSYLSNELDQLVIIYAMAVLTKTTNLGASQQFESEFASKVSAINQREAA